LHHCPSWISHIFFFLQDFWVALPSRFFAGLAAVFKLGREFTRKQKAGHSESKTTRAAELEGESLLYGDGDKF